MTDHPPALRTFFEDLIHAIRVWTPRFLILVLLIEAGPHIVEQLVVALVDYPECEPGQCGPLPTIVPFASLIFVLVFAGWFGTERIWYLRRFRGDELRREEIWLFTSAFRRRYIVLGFLFGLALIPLFLVVIPFSGSPVVAVTVFLAWTTLMDAALTFVTPALSFSTPKVFTSFRIALDFTSKTWPASALYLFIPPLALRLTLLAFWRGGSAPLVAVAIDVSAVVLNLWFKGATARFYLRYHEVDEDGSAFVPVTEDEGYALGR